VRPGRSRGPMLAGAVAAITLAVGAGAFLLLRGGSDGDGADNGPGGAARESVLTVTDQVSEPGPNGLPQRPGLHLAHPAGATADVPGGEVVFSDYVDLRRVSVPDYGPGWQGDGKAWQFTSSAGMVIEDTVSIRLPAAGAGEDARVIALSATGRWVAVPAERSGETLSVAMTNVPAPWLIAVARPVAVTPNSDQPPSEASQADALYWNDRDAWREQELAWLAMQDLTVTESAADPTARLTVSLDPTLAPARSWLDTQKDLDWALRILLGARATLEAGGALLPGGASGAVAFEQYRAAVSRLAAVRKEWVTYRARWAEAAGTPGDWSWMTFSDDMTMDQAIETACALYTPWGIDLTLGLLKGGNLDGMDLRVLAPYGEAYFTDIPFERKTLTFVDQAIDKVQMGAGEKTEMRALRLYSTRAIEDWSLFDYLKDWKTEAFLRYLPAALWAAGVTSGGPVLITATIADQVLDWYQNAEETAGDPYVYAGIEYAGTGLEATQLYLDATEEAVRTTFVGEFNIKNQAFGIAQFVYSAALSYAVANTDWYMLKDVRQVTAGSQAYCVRGSCNWFYAQQIPPLQVVAAVRGPAKQVDAAYPATRSRIMVWNLQQFMTYAGAPNLHRDFVDGRAPEAGLTAGKTSMRDLGWEEYVQDKWPDGIVATQPHGQAIRIAIPKDVLNSIAIDYELGPSPEFEDYGLVLRLETPDGKRNSFVLEKEGARLKSDDKDTAFVAVRLARNGVNPAEDPGEGLPEVYRGDGQTVDGGVLRTRLAGSISAHSDEKPRLTFEVDFSAAPWRIIIGDKEDPESQRIHLFDATPGARSNIYRLNKFEVTTWPDGAKSVLQAWRDGTLAPESITACETNPSSCYLIFYTPPGAPTGTLEAALTGPDRKPENGIIIATQLDADAPEGQRWLQFQNDRFFGIYTVDIGQDRICDGSLSGDTVSGRATIRTIVEADDPDALNLDGFPKGTVSLIFAGTRVK
jgi:hypothetical protein